MNEKEDSLESLIKEKEIKIDSLIKEIEEKMKLAKEKQQECNILKGKIKNEPDSTSK